MMMFDKSWEPLKGNRLERSMPLAMEAKKSKSAKMVYKVTFYELVSLTNMKSWLTETSAGSFRLVNMFLAHFAHISWLTRQHTCQVAALQLSLLLLWFVRCAVQIKLAEREACNSLQLARTPASKTFSAQLSVGPSQTDKLCSKCNITNPKT